VAYGSQNLNVEAGALMERLTPETVDLASAILSLAGIFVAAIAAPFVFHAISKGSVANFTDAIAKVTDSAEAVNQKIGALSLSFDRLQERLNVMDAQTSEQLSSLQVNQGRTQGRIEDEAAIAELEAPKIGVAAVDPTARERLTESWNQIRDLLEAAAADLTIDGRTGAKYARIDRRNYMHLAAALDEDSYLPGEIDAWEKAISLWYESRKHLKSDLGDRPTRMKDLLETLKAASKDSRIDYDLPLPEEIRQRACAGEFGPELRYELLLEHFSYYSETYLRQILPNFAEGGFKVRDGTPACFRRVAPGKYMPICTR